VETPRNQALDRSRSASCARSRIDAENAVVGFAERGFARVLIAIAQETGVAGYAGNGANRWPAGHTLDVGHLYRLALEDAPAGTRWHAVGDEGIPMREIAQSIGDHLGVPAASIPDDKLQAHFGFLAMLIALGNPTSSLVTRRILGWEPAHPGLIADFGDAGYLPPLPPQS
jgi:nucleoside-diphosphate-sugar epimerase